MKTEVYLIERADCVAFLRACAKRLLDHGDKFDPLIAKALNTCATQIANGEHEGVARATEGEPAPEGKR